MNELMECPGYKESFVYEDCGYSLPARWHKGYYLSLLSRKLRVRVATLDFAYRREPNAAMLVNVDLA